MAKDQTLDFLKQEEQKAFQKKQSAWQRFVNAKRQANAAHKTMEAAWQERTRTRDEMNSEYEKMQRAHSENQRVWDEYRRVRDYYSFRIDTLRREADSEHQAMIGCFNQASTEYEYGDRAMAPHYSQEGHEHKDRRDSLNDEVRELIQSIHEAKAYAESRGVRTDSSAFRSAKDAFLQAKMQHESAEAEFKRFKAERDNAKREFDSAQTEHARLKNEFLKQLEKVKAENRREREQILEKAGVRWSERSDAKIVKKSDGTTQVYSGGIGGGDGIGHGHVAFDRFGNKTYDRDAFAEHGKQNFTDEKVGGWTPYERGVIGDHEVTFRQGLGKNSGQTLISDGFVSGKQFDRHHNHYGKNDKSRYPEEPDFIEDSSKHKDDDAYSGPGH